MPIRLFDFHTFPRLGLEDFDFRMAGADLLREPVARVGIAVAEQHRVRRNLANEIQQLAAIGCVGLGALSFGSSPWIAFLYLALPLAESHGWSAQTMATAFIGFAVARCRAAWNFLVGLLNVSIRIAASCWAVHIAREQDFMHGTIDVVFTDHQATRDQALQAIFNGLDAMRKRLAKTGLKSEVSATKDGDEIKLFIQRGRHQVKVEVNHVFRGTVLPVEARPLGKEAGKLFTTELSVPILAAAELYGSKLVAAMDRQHPRDLFDVHCLFERGELAAEVVECFVCYLAGHNVLSL